MKNNYLQILVSEAGEMAYLLVKMDFFIYSMLWPGSARDIQNIKATGDN